jgi:hypothetical protein
LWLWTLVVLVGVYSTLGPAQSLVAELRQRNLLRVSMAVVLIPVGLVIARQWVRQRPGWREIGVGLGIAVTYLMAWARINTPEERTHLFEYGVVAILIHQALLERARHGRRVVLPAVLAVDVTALLGWLDEVVQAILPGRVYDLRDVGFNGFAALMAIGARVALSWARRRVGGPKRPLPGSYPDADEGGIR